MLLVADISLPNICTKCKGVINTINPKDYIDATARKIRNWQGDHFDWATQYVYGIEKDYRLVKVGKVGCYLHGDGLANVILSDGLANFSKNREYKLKLKKNGKDSSKDNQQFDVVLSNPPYAISSFRQTTRDYYTEKDFELYNYLTDNSSEIECLFVERTKQLLKENGLAGIILPGSILSNTGIYTKTRELILQYFDIVAITEFGSNTFMATGTNTVVLFLRRRSNYSVTNIYDIVNSDLITSNDITINGMEKPISKYVSHVWEGLNYNDYVTLLKKSPNDKVRAHGNYAEYCKKYEKIKAQDESEFWQKVVALEREKLIYFIIAYPQKIVLVKSGEKDAEKRFLGYEFSNRRGNEGIHPIQRSKNIEECTQLFDVNTYDNPEKASTYIYRAFNGDFESEIAENMQQNVLRVNLVDMLTFDRAEFEKTISTAVKKKVKTESKWEIVKLYSILNLISGQSPKSEFYNQDSHGLPFYQGKTEFGDIYLNPPVYWTKKVTKESLKGDVLITVRAPVGPVNINPYEKICIGRGLNALRVYDGVASNKYLFYYLYFNQSIITGNDGAIFQSISREQILAIKIPLPPLEIQQKIVAEIEKLEEQEIQAKEKIKYNKEKIEKLFNEANNKANKAFRLSNHNIFDVSIGERVLKSELSKSGIPVYSANVLKPFGYIDKYLMTDFSIPSVLWGIDGDWMVNFIPENTPFYPTDHCGVLRVKSTEILPKYVAWVLNKEGHTRKFSRTLRASIDRIEGLSVKAPSLAEQQKVVSEIEALEKETAQTQVIIDKIPAQKADILKKYL